MERMVNTHIVDTDSSVNKGDIMRMKRSGHGEQCIGSNVGQLFGIALSYDDCLNVLIPDVHTHLRIVIDWTVVNEYTTLLYKY